MPDKEIVDSLISEFTCPICREILTKPQKACKWGHTFCQEQEKVLQLLRLRGHEHTTDDGQMPVSQGPPSDAQQQSAPINHAPPDRQATPQIPPEIRRAALHGRIQRDRTERQKEEFIGGMVCFVTPIVCLLVGGLIEGLVSGRHRRRR
ncbi:hypothetical protein F5Y08DRAFT_334089 [Xylaria arbuscula]|nr:hypothetical protein F5Y08DRAFT_334089 [Xylaria arbuscula]